MVSDTAPVSEPLDIRILGAFDVIRSGQSLNLGGRRQREVLVTLLLARPAALSSERIADLVWVGSPPSGYLTTLQTYVFHLREILEPDRGRGVRAQVLVTVPGGYRLEVPDERVDARCFERLVAEARDCLHEEPARASQLLADGLGLWRGDVLEDFLDLEPVAREADRLGQLRAVASELRAEAELRVGHHATLTPDLDALSTRYPLHEHVHGLRMLALYRNGRQAEALAAYRELHTMLDNELGVEPSTEIRVLHERILRQDPTLEWEPAPAVQEAVISTPVISTPAQPEHAVTGDQAEIAVRPGATGRARASRRRRTAVAAAVAVVVALLFGTVMWVSASRDVVPVPPNTLAVISDRGLDGVAMTMSTAPQALVSGAGAVWVLDEENDALQRVDPDTRRVVQTIPGVGGSPNGLAVSGLDVWVAGTREGVLTRVNSATNRVVGKIQVGVQPSGVVATPTEVWVSNTADNTVQRVDPATGKAAAPIAVGAGPTGLLLEGTTLWVANSRAGTVTKVDTRSGERQSDDIRVGSGPRSPTLTDTDVWVANEFGQSVSRISRSTGRVVTIPVDDGPSSIVISDAVAWVGNAHSGTVSRIDTANNTVSRLDLGSAPRALAVVDGRVWVSTAAFGNPEHVGGTVVYTDYGDDRVTLDPASVYDTARLAMLRLVYDGLVSFQATGGAASQTLVPDLATTVPEPVNGGRTYVFFVRRGVTYSTGQEVKASDFVLGLRRALASKRGNAEQYSSLVGAPACIGATDPSTACGLEGGVSADDTTGRLTIQLSRPDPSFAYKLAYFVVPAPPGTPLGDTGLQATVPGTGPYVISSVDSRGNFTLTARPGFSAWSFSAQPRGYPDAIHYEIAPSPEAAVAEVLAGRADITSVMAAELPGLAGSAHLVHTYESYNTDWAYLNSRMAPFDDLRARQALNYAVDRRRFVDLYGGGPQGANLSCQLLPQSFPAWRPYCPYQTGPATGAYLGPDIERAKALVAQSGTADIPIVVHAYRGYPLWNAFPAYLADVLRSIGYRKVTVEDIPAEHASFQPRDPAYAGYQLFTQQGWLADFPDAQSFYDQFSCASPNISGYCNPAAEAVAAQAAGAAQTDASRSLDLWAEVDRRLTDDAAFVTLGGHHNAQLISSRVHNIQTRPVSGVLMSQLWVQ